MLQLWNNQAHGEVCQKQKRVPLMGQHIAKEESHILTTKGYKESPSMMTYQYGQRKWRGKANPAQPKNVPHPIWNRSKFQGRSLKPPPSLTMEITLILETHAEFRHISMGPTSFCTHQIDAIVDWGRYFPVNLKYRKF